MANYLTGRRPAWACWVLYPAVLAGTVFAAIVVAGADRPIVDAAAGLLVGWAAAAMLRYRERLHEQVATARRDPLTGLPTRAVIEETLRAATRAGTPVSVALADIDGLHTVNANLGHAAGDQYITLIAQRLTRAVPAGGVLCRQGGDEFTIVAPHLGADQLATRIAAAMTGPGTVGGHRLQPRASVGVAQSRGGDGAYTRACADAAQYTAKASGGNRVLTYHRDRDGRPRPDGTRPLVRRRDFDPPRQDGRVWTPTPGDGLLPVLWSPREAAAIHAALVAAADRGTPTTAGETAADQRVLYTGLADRLARVLDAADPTQST